jgi:hypothetical protein
MESQMSYILRWLDELDELDKLDTTGTYGYFDVKPERQRDYNAEVQQKLSTTVWAAGCNSWYLDRQGRNSTVFPGLTRDYRRTTAQFHVDDYESVRSATAPSLL